MPDDEAMKISNESKAEILYDHYKDTFEHTQFYIKQRDWLFLGVLLIVATMLFQIVAPSVSGDALSEFVLKRFGLTTPIDASFINTMLWFSLLATVVRYYQRTVHVERQYHYLHRLEKKIDECFGSGIFEREGAAYLNSHNTFSDWAWRLYTLFFPILLIVISLVKIVVEYQVQAGTLTIRLFNSAAFIGVVCFTVLYLFSVHYRPKNS